MGSPSVAVPILRAIIGLDWPVLAVYTAPDRRTGRGQKLGASPVKEEARGLNIPVEQPENLRLQEVQETLASYEADLIVVAAYGRLLPDALISGPRWGCINVHPSLLPKYRGASPVPSTIINGDKVTGVTLMVLDHGMDTGPILAQSEALVVPGDDTPRLTERLFNLGAKLVGSVLPRYIAGEVTPKPQERIGVSVSRPLEKKDGEIDWARPAEELERQVRAYRHWPGAASSWEGKRIEILDAQVVGGGVMTEPGTIISLHGERCPFGISTSNGILGIVRLKLAGGSAMGAAEFLRGHSTLEGARLPS